MIGKSKAKAVAGSPRYQLLEAQRAIVARAEQLLELREVEDAAQRAVIESEGILASVPRLPDAGLLWATCDQVMRGWQRTRRDLASGGPEPISRQEAWVASCRLELARAEQMLAQYQQALAKLGRQDSQARADVQRIATAWVERLQAERGRLADALLAKGNLSMAERKEVAALTDQQASRVAVALSV